MALHEAEAQLKVEAWGREVGLREFDLEGDLEGLAKGCYNLFQGPFLLS